MSVLKMMQKCIFSFFRKICHTTDSSMIFLLIFSIFASFFVHDIIFFCKMTVHFVILTIGHFSPQNYCLHRTCGKSMVKFSFSPQNGVVRDCRRGRLLYVVPQWHESRRKICCPGTKRARLYKAPLCHPLCGYVPYLA